MKQSQLKCPWCRRGGTFFVAKIDIFKYATAHAPSYNYYVEHHCPVFSKGIEGGRFKSRQGAMKDWNSWMKTCLT